MEEIAGAAASLEGLDRRRLRLENIVIASLLFLLFYHIETERSNRYF
ncbi:MAG: hypothetical protein ACLULH_14245 [Bacteroides fragilis]